jgi:hypothetical protein
MGSLEVTNSELNNREAITTQPDRRSASNQMVDLRILIP